MAIGQGENAQTVVNMARFYSALATDGTEPTPMIKQGTPKLSKRITLSPEQIAQLRKAMMGVVSRGRHGGRRGDQGSEDRRKDRHGADDAQFDKNGKPLYYAWFAGMAPAEDPEDRRRGDGAERDVRGRDVRPASRRRSSRTTSTRRSPTRSRTRADGR